MASGRHARSTRAPRPTPVPPYKARHGKATRRPPASIVLIVCGGIVALGSTATLHPRGPRAAETAAESTAVTAVATLGPPLIQPLAPLTAAAPAPLAAALLTSVPTGLPRRAAEAYARAAQSSGCPLPWTVLAGIGWIESHHAASGGSARPDWDGVARPAIIGPRLDGSSFAAVPDTDHGALDGDSEWDRAVGPMQFIPSTWARWSADGNADGRRDPQSIDDASLAAAHYLCAAGDPTTADGLRRAVFAYNHDDAYVRAVLTAAQVYGSSPVALQALSSLPVASTSPVPAADAGPAPALRPMPTQPGQPSSRPPAPRPAPGSASPPGGPSSEPTTTSAPSPSPSPVATTSPTPDEVPCVC
jgi:hypothetical protein